MQAAQPTTPNDLNAMTDDTLKEFVHSVLQNITAPASASSMPPEVAPFVTAEVLARVHKFVWACSTDKGIREPKQVLLAQVVAIFTGVTIAKEDAEYIGNAEASFVSRYQKQIKKARQALSTAMSKAKKAGKELPENHVARDRLAALQCQLYACPYGGVPRRAVATHLPLHTQRVPVRRESSPPSNSVQTAKSEAQQTHGSERDRERDVRRVAALAEREKRSRERAECMAAAQTVARNQAEDKAAKALMQLQEHERNSRVEATRSQAVIARLGHQIGVAHVEAARAIELSERERVLRERVMQEKVNLLAAKEKESAQAEQQLKVQQHEAMREAERAQAEIMKLGTKLGIAHAEAARAKELEGRERAKRERLQQEKSELITKMEDEAAQAERMLKQGERAAKRAFEKEVKRNEACIARLGSQLSVAQVEVARAKELEERERLKRERMIAEKENLLAQKQAENERLRNLKAQMAKRKRDALALASSAEQLEKQLHSSQRRCRELRQEVNANKARLCIDHHEISDEESTSSGRGYSSGDDTSDRPWQLTNVAKKDEESRCSAAEAQHRISCMPTWRAVRGKGEGKGRAKIEWGTRLIIYSLLGMLVPPSAIGRAIVAIVKRTAPWLNPTAPTCETVQRCRFELRLVEEALAARRVAEAFRIRSIGYDETTKFGNASLTSNVQIQVIEGGQFEDVILRAAYCPMGGTAELVVQSIESRCFARLRSLLRRWKALFEQMFPNEVWTGPDPARCSLHRLGGGGGIITDTCNTARCSTELLGKLIAQQVQDELRGEERWSAMAQDEREDAVRTHPIDCWQHLRNIFLAEMSRAQAQHLHAELRAELETFAAWERMSTEFSQLLRAAFKEFHHSCRYYKGQGRAFNVWLRDTYPTDFSLHLERADGGRQDLDYDAAVPLYIDRRYFVEYLHHERVFMKGHKNILEDFLYVTFRSLQYVAAARANAIIDVLISRPMRWLSGKSSQLHDWSPRSMGEVLDLVEQFFLRAQHDGSMFFDPTLDLFEPIARKQPLFAEWQRQTFEEEHVLSPDRSRKHLVWKLVREELLNPQDPTNKLTHDKTIEYLEVQCAAGIRKMHDPRLALCDQLTSKEGIHSIGRSADAHADLVGCHATNDSLSEGTFGTFDMILRRCSGVSQEAASAVAQACRSKMLSFGDNVAHRKESTKAEVASYEGLCFKLPPHEQESLVELPPHEGHRPC